MKFKIQAESWLRSQEIGNNPRRRSTVSTYRSALNVHLIPRFGEQSLEDLVQINNKALRGLVCDPRATHKPASIHLVATLFKQVVQSVKNENGLPLYAVTWATDFIDLPAIANQKQPTVSPEQVQSVVQDGPDATLYLLLAASGLRIVEGLNLRREDYADGTIHIREGKTTNAARYVDLASPKATKT